MARHCSASWSAAAFAASRIGEVAIGRTAVILKSEKYEIELRPIRIIPMKRG